MLCLQELHARKIGIQKLYKLGHGTEVPAKASKTRDLGIRGAAEKPGGGVLTGSPMLGWRFSWKRGSLGGVAGWGRSQTSVRLLLCEYYQLFVGFPSRGVHHADFIMRILLFHYADSIVRIQLR